MFKLSFIGIDCELGGDRTVDQAEAETVKAVVQSLVKMLEEATQIIDFFQKLDEQRRVKRNIKRVVIEHFDESLVALLTERFMELVEVKFN